jgi:hypothetical protein
LLQHNPQISTPSGFHFQCGSSAGCVVGALAKAKVRPTTNSFQAVGNERTGQIEISGKSMRWGQESEVRKTNPTKYLTDSFYPMVIML